MEILLLGIYSFFVWLIVFKLYGLYDRDIKRISHATLDDLPWLFHALLIGTLLFWVLLKVSPYHQLTLDEAIVFGGTALLVVSLLRFLVRRTVLSVHDWAVAALRQCARRQFWRSSHASRSLVPAFSAANWTSMRCASSGSRSSRRARYVNSTDLSRWRRNTLSGSIAVGAGSSASASAMNPSSS